MMLWAPVANSYSKYYADLTFSRIAAFVSLFFVKGFVADIMMRICI